MNLLFEPPSSPTMLVWFNGQIAEQLLDRVRQERPNMVAPLQEAIRACTADEGQAEAIAVKCPSIEDGNWLFRQAKDLESGLA